jgi:photosystem I P700 chlorophyll a apoprotein A2
MATKFPKFSQALAQDPATRRIWYGIATAHDLESHDGMTEESLYQKIFASHFGHLAIIFLWTSGNLFHVAWQGNFEQWILNPLKVKPIAHAIWDPHFGEPALKAFTRGGVTYPVNIAYSGVYHWWYTIGMRSNSDLYFGSLGLLILSSVLLFAGWLHLQPKFKPSLSWFKNNESRLNHHLSGLLGISSLAWTGHLVHVAIPESRGVHIGWDNFLVTPPHPDGLKPFFSGDWLAYASNPDTSQHVFGSNEGAGTAILTFVGGFDPQTQSLWLTDIAHHQLAIAVIFIIAGHMYRTNFGIGHDLKEILDAHRPPGGRLGAGHRGLFDTITNSLHMQLGLALACLGVATSLTAQHMYALPAYAYIAKDFTTQAALYTHHQYIAGFLMVGAFAHGAIFFVRDYDPEMNKDNVLARMLEHKEAIISHLSWVSLFLGFHTLGLYIHNDTVVAFGQPEKQILVEPIFAQWIQAASGKALYGFNVLLSSSESSAALAGTKVWLPGWSEAINNNSNSLFLTIGPGDFLVHHAIALGLHTTTLILVKGALDARGSKLMPDKKRFWVQLPL